MAPRRSRWALSEVTFGPLGRLVASVLLLVPVWWFISSAGVFAIIGVPIWLGVIAPWGMRDIWRPVAKPPTQADTIADTFEAAACAEQAGGRRADFGAGPRRW